MKVYDAASIRNVTIAGHSGAGKTQLAAAILFDAGMINRFGKVDDGTTVTDFDEEEVSRKHTLGASLAYAEWNKHKINLIDTPGFGNFLSDTLAAMRVSDAAAIVVDAVSGVEVQTEKVWEAAEENQLPRLVLLNRVDRERASLSRSLESLNAAFGRTVIPVQLPIGEEKSFRGVADLVAMKAYIFQTEGSGKFKEEAVPGEMQAEVESAREALIEPGEAARILSREPSAHAVAVNRFVDLTPAQEAVVRGWSDAGADVVETFISSTASSALGGTSIQID